MDQNEKAVEVTTPRSHYFSDQLDEHPRCGVLLDLESTTALRFLEHFAIVAGKTEGEDKAGRARCDLQGVAEVVDRAFAIAEAFVKTAEARGGIKAVDPVEKRVINAALLDKLRTENTYVGHPGETPAATSIQEIKDRIARRRAEVDLGKKQSA